MKTVFILLSLSTMIVTNACKKTIREECASYETKTSPKAGALPKGECNTQSFDNDVVKICYDSLINESRCPINGNCVWQGYAVGKFTLTVNGNTHTLTLCTLQFNQFSRDTIIGNYKIELQDLYPYPGEQHPSSASAAVKITRL